MQKQAGEIIQTTFSEWSKIPTTIGFRLDTDHRGTLAERANALKMSVHELARHYVIQALHETDERQQLVTAIVGLRDLLSEARKDIAVSTQELLVSAGTATVGQAKSWVKDNLI